MLGDIDEELFSVDPVSCSSFIVLTLLLTEEREREIASCCWHCRQGQRESTCWRLSDQNVLPASWIINFTVYWSLLRLPRSSSLENNKVLEHKAAAEECFTCQQLLLLTVLSWQVCVPYVRCSSFHWPQGNVRSFFFLLCINALLRFLSIICFHRSHICVVSAVLSGARCHVPTAACRDGGAHRVYQTNC